MPDDSAPTALADTLASGDANRERLAEGTLVGRYRIDSVLGAGGMGIVYRARDPELGRDVAVKVIAPRRSDVDPARLLREAQAMAKLRHPNVVPIFDVGTLDDTIFVVMPMIEGGTLGAWLRGARRPWREVLDRFAAAGRGLVAAHAAGLVHRDFKPDNVLIGGNGEILVADFGLARDATGAASDERGAAVDTPSSGVVGTLAYMAPEQLRGEDVDARADQYSFSVALWEGLYGQRPQETETRPATVRAKLQHRGGDDRSFPGWLRAAVTKGLAHDPRARWSSLADLLSYIERRRRLPKRVGALAAFGVVAALTTTVVVLGRNDGGGVACEHAGDAFAAHWTPEQRAKLDAAFTSGRPYGADAARRTVAALDAYGARWRAARVDVCNATHRRGEQSADVLDRRMRCLDRGLADADALIATLQAADARAIDRSLGAVESLPPPESCDAHVADALPIPADPRAQAVVEQIAAAKAARSTGNQAEARRLAALALTAAEELGHPGLLADARTTHAMLTVGSDPERSLAALEAALTEAVKASDRDLEARVAIDLLEHANRSGDPDRIGSMLPIARAAVQRIPRTSPWQRAFTRQEYRALHALGKFDEALGACDRLASQEDAPYLASLECRCTTALAAVRNADAAAHCRDTVAAAETKYGVGHVSTAPYLGNLEIAEDRLGNYDAALEIRNRTLQMYEAAYGAESSEFASELHNRGALYTNMGRYADARTDLERALRILEEQSDKPTKSMGKIHDVLGKVLAALGDVNGSLREADISLRVTETILGTDHPDLVLALLGHGEVYMKAKRYDIALESNSRGEKLALEKLGATHPFRAYHLLGKAQCLVELARSEEAISAAEMAVRILDGTEDSPNNIASAHGVLGLALLRGGDRARARAELEKARGMLAPLGESARAELAQVEKHLAELDRLSR